MNQDAICPISKIIKIILIVCCFGCSVSPLLAQSIPAGSGAASIVIYDNNHNVLQEHPGFSRIWDCRSTSDGSVLLALEGHKGIVKIDKGGSTSSIPIEVQPLRIKINPQGEFLVVSYAKVLLLNPDGSTKHSVPVDNVSDAEFYSADSFVAVNGTWIGSLAHVSWAGKELWRSPNNRNLPGFVGPLTSIVNKIPDNYLISDGRHIYLVNRNFEITPHYDANQLLSGVQVRSTKENRILSFSTPNMLLGLIHPSGKEEILQSTLQITCGDFTNNGGYLLGLIPRAGEIRLNKTQHQRYLAEKPTLTISSLAGVLLVSLCISLAAASLVRTFFVKKGTLQTVQDPACRQSSPESRDRANPARASSIGHRIKVLLWLALFVGGCAATTFGVFYLRELRLSPAFALLCIGGFAVSWALIALGQLSQAAPDFINFGTRPNKDAPRGGISLILIILAAAALIACTYLQKTMGDTKAGIGFWVAAQVFFLSAFPPQSTSSIFSNRAISRFFLPILLIISVFLRFWNIGFYPDQIHHDHGIIGQSALKVLLGDWSPFFVLDPYTNGMMRPWLLPMSAFLHIFGADYWVLRISNAAWGIVLIYSCYLLGSALASQRLGIIFATLVAVQHSLLNYTRQPYVVESTAPFILSLYFLVLALKSGALRSWAWCGFWAAYSMLSVRSCTTFPFIWLALFLYSCIFMPRVLLKRKLGILTLAAAGLVVYAPFLINIVDGAGSILLQRLGQMSVLFDENLKLNPDLDVWLYQFGRSFGGFLIFRDTSHWCIYTKDPIFIRWGVGLFCSGLLYFIIRLKNPVAPFILISLIINVSLGSAMLVTPPSYYHFFVGITLSLLIAAVPLERLWTIGRSVRNPIARYVTAGIVLCYLVMYTEENLRSFVDSFKRPNIPQNQVEAWGPDVYSIAARYVNTHRGSRFYIIKKPHGGLAANDAIFHFLGFHSDISDILYDLANSLPIKPNDQEERIVFLLLPERADDVAALKFVYPNGEWSQLFFGPKPEVINVLTVTQEGIREAFLSGRTPPADPQAGGITLKKIR